jgi:hypothetical protein
MSQLLPLSQQPAAARGSVLPLYQLRLLTLFPQLPLSQLLPMFPQLPLSWQLPLFPQLPLSQLLPLFPQLPLLPQLPLPSPRAAAASAHDRCRQSLTTSHHRAAGAIRGGWP